MIDPQLSNLCLLCDGDASKSHWGVFYHYDEYAPEYLDGCAQYARICEDCAKDYSLKRHD